MKINHCIAVMMLAVGLGFSMDHADAGHDIPPYKGSKEFESLKTLAGYWEGTSADMTEGNEKLTVDYKVTSGGSAVIETLFPGTPQEMVSVYSEDANRLTMTHFCMLQNHPKLELKKTAGTDLSFALAKDGNVDPKSIHMHNLVISMPSPDQLIQKWTSYENGKENKTSTFTFNRK